MIYSLHNEVYDFTSAGDKPVPWWSFTKTVIATLILRCVEQGKIELDAKLNGKPYTYRQLLQHTSGLTDYAMLREYHQAVAKGDSPWSCEEMLAKVQVEELLFNPGEGWRYSNIGYLMLRQQIEQCHDAPFTAVLNGLFNAFDISNSALIESSADFDKLKVNSQSYDPRWCYHGVIAGSVHNAAKFLHLLMNGLLISKPMLKRMLAPYKLTFDVGQRPWKSPAVGLGVMLNCEPKLKTTGHTGQGPQSCFAAYHFAQANPITITVFEQTDSQAVVEDKAVELAKAFVGR
ncbi:beta-lactamase family protein [Pseudoalteromonas sp. SMS1]|uniref:serine hydrolase domain-containing protein n=1 Tax=Pseudoalteromonas sp. SMS1 TaxID=2908894 RepID=UPI001F2E662C|nr:serine hydrolase domain-containing protein [Pseudoalteromonas sp. SMS1]MCF2857040.1 beta-lactamase family protein [Pseudoalteromonas sp. SMS1]